MSNTPNPDPDLTAAPGGRWLAGLSLAILALLGGHLVTTPDVAMIIAGFAAAIVLPVVVAIVVVRVIVGLPRVVEWARRREGPVTGIVPERIAAEETD